MPYFGVPIRNGLPIGLGTLTALAKAVAVVVPPVSSDPFFEYVSLLLNTTSTNGAQNNTFLDSSTNAFSITRNGNTTQGTFSPFSQTGWSNFFDGTGDYLAAPSNAAFALSGSDLTIEGWVYLTAYSPSYVGVFAAALCGTANGGTSNGYQFTIVGTASSYTGINFFARSATVTQVDITGTQSIPLNTWTHIAVTKSGTTYRLFVNGVVVNTVTNANAWTDTNTLDVGQSGYPGYQYSMPGYISNFRIVKGTAVYTANFTPPTAPLTAITNTSLLTCQSNRFIDNSSNAFAITRNGDVSVQAFSPFNPTAAWSASTNGGSGYFDGTGDYLLLPSTSNLAMGTGDFCIEMWIYPTALSGDQALFFNGTAGDTQICIFIRSTSTIRFSTFNTALLDTAAGTVVQNTWSHVVVCRAGTTASIFINGTRQATGTVTTNFSATDAFNIGRRPTNDQFYVGYMGSVRAVKGSSVYDPTLTTLTVPTSPLTAITNTQFLCNFANAGIYDSASGNDLETVGNAQVSTTQAKWGTTSMAFDGTGDWLTVPDSPTQRFGTGDFTVEFWMYVTGGLAPTGVIGKGTSTTGWEISWQSGGTLRFTFGSTNTTSVATFNNNTWYHVALVRSGSATGNVKLYLDGTAIITSGTAVTDNLNQTNVMYIGANRTGANAFTGYIDDLRITNGYARYTANFTPPTAAFPLN